jgi:AcrR family transcriptional regulator
MMLPMRADSGVGSGLRSDARRNRNLLLRAAGEVLREQGLDAPLDEIARRAGVGNATLYRHFPTRENLYEAVFAEAGALLERIWDRTLGIEDPWLALVAYFEEACGFFATDRGLSDLMVQGMPRSRVLDELRAKGDLLMRTLLERAQHAGVVRADVDLSDVILLFCALQRLVPAVELVCPGSWRRHLAITLDGLRPNHGAGLPPSVLNYDQLLEIGQCFHAPRAGDRGRRRRP